jgi:hypothetical protein
MHIKSAHKKQMPRDAHGRRHGVRDGGLPVCRCVLDTVHSSTWVLSTLLSAILCAG